jgi:phosphatidylserine/phosphatidylglycerophosphate/cardiolipin synthase-like enzyme
MKLKKATYNQRKTFFIIGAIVIFFIVCIYATVHTFLTMEKRRSHSFGPQKVISVPSPLVTNIYFNNEIGGTESISLLLEQIEKAEHTIEIAMFSFGSVEIRDALYEAAKRSVRVTLVLNKSKYKQHDLLFVDPPPGVTRIDVGTFDPVDSRRTTYMHDKFMIIDRGFDNAHLTTGSLNFTPWGEKYNQSFFVMTSDSHLVEIYGKEFDSLKGNLSGIKKLADLSYNPWAATINYSSSTLEVWFSPGFSTQSVKSRIINTIASSTESLDLIMWEFTDNQIAAALRKKAEEGVRIRIIAEDLTSTGTDSMIPSLIKTKEEKKLDNLEIILDTKLAAEVREEMPDDFTPFIHHHSIIADGKMLILGSGNWTLWGFYNNDENAWVTNDAYLIQESQKTFEHFYDLLK